MAMGKGRRRIVVGEVEYHWHANGDDGVIAIAIAPENGIGPRLLGCFGYHAASWGDQIVVTPKLIRRVIEYAVAERGYDPQSRGKEIQLQCLDDVIQWDDAVRAGDPVDSGPQHDPKTGAIR